MNKIFPDSVVSILGLGYVGLTLGVAMADAGFKVHGVEVRDTILDSLQKSKAHFWEQDLDETLKKVVESGNFSFSKSYDAVPPSDVYIITVGTPLDDSGQVRLDMIQNATHQIAENFKHGALVILRSTVRIGTARKVVKPILDMKGIYYELAVCPERTLEGNAMNELRQLPQIIGAETESTLFRASHLFSRLTPTTVRVDKWETAELIKLVDNTYRDVTFSFANEVARICDAIGVSSAQVIQAGKLGYPRTNVAWPGPVGGPCLEKDPHILSQSAEMYGVNLDVTVASRRVNERQPIETVESIVKFLVAKGINRNEVLKISILGLAFKGVPATNDLRGTVAKSIMTCLKQSFPHSRFIGFDPHVSDQDILDFGLEPAKSIEEAFDCSNLVVIANNNEQFKSLKIDSLSSSMRPMALVYDYWGLFVGKNLAMQNKVAYMALGNQTYSS
ncbi:MAG: nucleotide sugar dehydrogenase [Polynucleobacter sp.]|nr:nucleotide sugar dehydrogenase [Polynucleobacter sp.]